MTHSCRKGNAVNAAAVRRTMWLVQTSACGRRRQRTTALPIRSGFWMKSAGTCGGTPLRRCPRSSPAATSKNSVVVVTGCTVETSMPWCESSDRIARATIACAAFEAEYAPCRGRVNFATQLEHIRRCPGFFSTRRRCAACCRRSAPEKKFTSNMRRISSIGVASTSRSSP